MNNKFREPIYCIYFIVNALGVRVKETNDFFNNLISTLIASRLISIPGLN